MQYIIQQLLLKKSKTESNRIQSENNDQNTATSSLFDLHVTTFIRWHKLT